MKEYEKGLVDTLSLLTIVVALSSVGSMYVYYMGTFTRFALPEFMHQLVIIVLSLTSFIYLGYALYLYHHRRK